VGLSAAGGALWPAHSGSRTSDRQGTPVCAAVGGPVSAASLKRTLRGWTAPALRWAARHGLDMGRAAPYPAEVATLRGRSSGLLLRAMCCGHQVAGSSSSQRNPRIPAACLAGRGALPHAPWQPKRLPVAAAFFFLLQRQRKVIFGSCDARAARAALPIASDGSPPCDGLPKIGGRSARRKKNTNAAATGPSGQGA